MQNANKKKIFSNEVMCHQWTSRVWPLTTHESMLKVGTVRFRWTHGLVVKYCQARRSEARMWASVDPSEHQLLLDFIRNYWQWKYISVGPMSISLVIISIYHLLYMFIYNYVDDIWFLYLSTVRKRKLSHFTNSFGPVTSLFYIEIM